MEEKDERKKLWTFLLTILCIFLMPIKGMAVETTGTQDDAIDAYEQIEEVLEIRTDIFMDNYPDSFAGCYLDGNMLVILLTDLKDADIYLDACNNSPYVRFEEKEYSYTYLKNLEKTSTDLIGDYKINESYVDIKKNCVVYGLLEDEYETYIQTKSSIDLPIQVILTEEATANAMQGGEGISNDKAGMSIGFFGTYKGKKALLTCGHENPVGSNVYYNGTKIGNIVHQEIRTYLDYDPRTNTSTPSSHGDFAIVDISQSPISTSMNVLGENGTSIKINGTAYVIEGLEVKFYGNTTKYGTGTVTQLNQKKDLNEPISWKPYRVYGLVVISSNHIAAGGDSGGSVYYTSSLGNNKIAGTIVGNNRDSRIIYMSPIVHAENVGFDFD